MNFITQMRQLLLMVETLHFIWDIMNRLQLKACKLEQYSENGVTVTYEIKLEWMTEVGVRGSQTINGGTR